jgi:hypothetical protein
MTTREIDTQSNEKSAVQSTDFWKALREDLDADEFWADKIKKFRGEPVKRLRKAINTLPLPAAFREAAIATRALIKDKRKARQDFNEELTLLYWLAAVRSFMLEYALRLAEPGYNVVESIPAKQIKSLPFSYKELGYERLELLNKTDRKWIAEKWGEPETHSTLNELHKNLWDEYETNLIEKRKKEQEGLWSDLTGGQSRDEPTLIGWQQKRSKERQFVGLLLLLIFLILYGVFNG